MNPKYIAILAIVLSISVSQSEAVAQSNPFVHGPLQVNPDGRYLQHSDGTPFLYLGDTAWELFSRLTVTEAETYLENRRLKGFTVIQAVILTEVNNTVAADPVSQWILTDTLQINQSYLSHIDTVISIACRKGLYIALLPAWGDKVDKQWGKGPVLFDAEQARRYGRMLGHRYADRPNIIWVLGGDRSGTGKNKTVWHAMAEGIKEFDSDHLMTFHPQGEHSSSLWFHNEKWLDFNMFQSGHCQSSYEIYRRLLLHDYALSPVKPVIDGEPRYEDMPKNFQIEQGRYSDYDIRKSLYHSMLSGACGYTYGCNNIWQMYDLGCEPKCHARTPWYQSLDMQGACQLIYFRHLWDAFPFVEGKPKSDAIEAEAGYEGDEAVAFGNQDYLLCYFPEGEKWTVRLDSAWRDSLFSLQWLNPSDGTYCDIGEDMGQVFQINLPSEKSNKDWVLIIKRI